ncbi:hypothetical protein FOPG_19268 [Fusarium oxysporum f. sp. conglutinans race 2 54008]|uniref:Uncharacterized protein n=1 Tax=Fusarium oxysporum f. sp. conglutinans race 2 54008 TaxID=1089457 RepID=X0GLI8_FUSOX|nr:hypothetical protein FOPG_19268 [Fusarium oxysporum f. sp. conglutinans race 2 54008]
MTPRRWIVLFSTSIAKTIKVAPPILQRKIPGLMRRKVRSRHRY